MTSYVHNEQKQTQQVVFIYLCVCGSLCCAYNSNNKNQRGIQFDIMEEIKTSTTWRVGGHKEKEDVI